ncbi:DUF6221 family protein [Streptomyces sp. NPDC055025]
MTDDLVAFIRARLNEDEEIARRAGDSFRQIGETGVIVATEGDRAEECASANWAGVAEHIVAQDPARVLREIDAKRKTLDDCEGIIVGWHYEESKEFAHDVLRNAALPYVDHADYREEWRP